MFKSGNEWSFPEGPLTVKVKFQGVDAKCYPLRVEKGVPYIEFPIIASDGSAQMLLLEIRREDVTIGSSANEFVIESEMSSPYLFLVDQQKNRLELGELYIALNAADTEQAALVRGEHVVFNTKGKDAWCDPVIFLRDYFYSVVGREWLNVENMRVNGPHPLAIITQLVENEFKNARTDQFGRRAIETSNPLIGWFLDFCFHLFMVAVNRKLERRSLERLKRAEMFWSTVHEIFVVSSFLRSRFHIELEDESDRSSRHPEFIAIHKETGSRFAVEAKMANQNIFTPSNDFRDWKDPKGFRFRRLINDAISKNPSDPLVIVIDLNRMPINDEKDQVAFNQFLARQLKTQISPEGSPDKWVRLEFINRPFLFSASRNVPLTFSHFVVHSVDSIYAGSPELSSVSIRVFPRLEEKS